jgi:hypothetical protein
LAASSAIIAFVAVVAGIILMANGTLSAPTEEPPARMVVIGTAPTASGSEVAVLAYVFDLRSRKVTVLDTLLPATVAGTSAMNAREAFPFGGGAAVSAALSQQTATESLPWIVVPSSVWKAEIDNAGGIAIPVPRRFISYGSGSLTMLEEGTQTLSGTDASVVAGSVALFKGPGEAAAVLRSLTTSVSTLLSESGTLVSLVREGMAESSVPLRSLEPYAAD